MTREALPEGFRYVVKPPPGYTWEYVPPAKVQESAPAAVAPCSASPRGLPGEQPHGTGYCTFPVQANLRPIPDVRVTARTLDYLRAEARWLEAQPTEHVITFALNTAGEVTGCIRHTDGEPRSCTVPIPQIVRESQGYQAAGVMVLHNHPRAQDFNPQLGRHWYGAIEPSSEDIETTHRLREALQAAGIRLVDHLICGPNARPYSFREADMPMVSEWDERCYRLEARGY
jgi:hypothetical protein